MSEYTVPSSTFSALISHAFGKVVSPMKYSDDHRVNLELEQMKRDEQEKSSSKLNLALPPQATASPQGSVNSKASGSTSLHFYDSRPMTAYNYKHSPNKVSLMKFCESYSITLISNTDLFDNRFPH